MQEIKRDKHPASIFTVSSNGSFIETPSMNELANAPMQTKKGRRMDVETLSPIPNDLAASVFSAITGERF